MGPPCHWVTFHTSMMSGTVYTPPAQATLYNSKSTERVVLPGVQCTEFCAYMLTETESESNILFPGSFQVLLPARV